MEYRKKTIIIRWLGLFLIFTGIVLFIASCCEKDYFNSNVTDRARIEERIFEENMRKPLW